MEGYAEIANQSSRKIILGTATQVNSRIQVLSNKTSIFVHSLLFTYTETNRCFV